MIGGSKAGNIISPNPNTIAVSEAFGQDLTAVMFRNAVPAVFALIAAILLSSVLSKKEGTKITADDMESAKDGSAFLLRCYYRSGLRHCHAGAETSCRHHN